MHPTQGASPVLPLQLVTATTVPKFTFIFRQALRACLIINVAARVVYIETIFDM